MDWELISKLLDVCDGTGDYPKFKAIHDEAEATLVDLNKDAVKLLAERKKKTDEEQAKVEAEAQAARDKAKADAEAAEKAEGSYQTNLQKKEEVTHARRR